MKSISIFASALLLVGCQCTPQVISEPVEVKIPVPVPCRVAAVQKPNWIMDNPDFAEQHVFNKAVAALQELEQRRAYERELEAAITACAAELQ